MAFAGDFFLGAFGLALLSDGLVFALGLFFALAVFGLACAAFFCGVFFFGGLLDFLGAACAFDCLGVHQGALRLNCFLDTLFCRPQLLQ